MAFLRVYKLANESSFGRKKALFEGVLAGTLFGTAAVLIRLLKDMDVFSIASWRLIIAFLVLAATIFFLRKPFGFGLLKRNFVQVLFLGVLLGLHFVLFVSAVKDTTIINATVLVNTTPIWSVLVSVLILGVKPTRLAVLGLIVSFLGVTVIAYADVASPTFSLNLKGDLEALFAAVFEAFYLSYGRDTRRKVPILSLMLFIYMLSTLTVLAAASAAAWSAPIFSTVSLKVVLILVGLGVLPTALAHTLYFSSLSSLKSFETATLALLEPIAATLLGVLIFAEIPGFLFVIGAVLVLSGILSVATTE
ncbi:MAG: DMT family transporter [Candidatus Bathyarchaeota archaeon]|nr:DMT family transporter [Candidatus Bathyarchaeota archaeon]